jgi:hypothetical protein
METPRKKRRRPPKGGVKDPSHFARALMFTNSCDQAREGGEKRSAAITEGVNSVKQSVPRLPLSETEGKRILAEFRPKDSETGLIVRASNVDAAEKARRRNLRAQVPGFGGTIPAELAKQNLQKCPGFQFGIGQRPVYPRHNAKAPNS